MLARGWVPLSLMAVGAGCQSSASEGGGGLCNGRIFHLFILSYRARLSYLITARALSSFLSMAVA